MPIALANFDILFMLFSLAKLLKNLAKESNLFCSLSPNKSTKAIFSPSVADLKRSIAPCKLSPTISAIASAAPSEFLSCSVSIATLSALSNILPKAAAVLLSVIPKTSERAIPESFISFSLGKSSSTEETEPPNLLDSFDVGSANLNNIFLKEVPAIDASIPASVREAKIAVVPSISKPAIFAIGATFVIDV